MYDSSHHVALAALEIWASTVTGQPAAPVAPAIQPVVSQAAWRLAGAAPPDDGAWPPPTSGRLQTIFSRLSREGRSPLEATMRPASLGLTQEVLFPTTDRAESTAPPPAEALRGDLDRLAGRDLPVAARLEATLFALQRHAWALPSPLPAVSLYDFARSHAALAAALAASPTGELCLVGGDLSGVQEFIYSVPAAGAARQLRGRSLYLQLLTDACAHAVLSQAGAPLCNLLYAGGGRFYALLPGRCAEQVAGWRGALGRHLLGAHGGALYLALGSSPTFQPDAYSEEIWRKLSEAIDGDKRRRFAALAPDEFRKLFEPSPSRPPRPDSEEEPPDTMGVSLADLGRQISRATILAVRPGQVQEPAFGRRDHTWRDLLRSLGLHTLPLDEEPTSEVGRGRYRRVLQLADDDPPPLRPGDIIGVRYTVTEARRATQADVGEYRRLGLNADENQELHINDVLPFNYLAACSEGVKRIGVLRMDVDDLGDLFGTKLNRPSGIAGLAATAALSAALSRFFEGWVGALCRETNQGERGGVYAVYSGGDDLFLVGSWHLMPGLARRIRDDFARYVLGRPLGAGEAPPISLSAGITLHTAGYPLYQAADDAAQALDAAKGFTRADQRAKDAITFLGRTLGWEQFAEAEALKEELVDLIGRGAPRALLMVIQGLAARALGGDRRARSGERQLSYGPWVWQGAYQLTRMAERAGGATGEQIADLRERLVGQAGIQRRTIERAGLAARWAQLLVRGEGEA